MTNYFKRLLLTALLALLPALPAGAYPCFYEPAAPTRLGTGQTLLAAKVDAATGAFIYHFRCMTVPGVVPLIGAIYYNTQDNSTGPFGKGTSTPYDWFIRPSVTWPGAPYVLIGPGNNHYVFDTNASGVYKDTRDPLLLGATLSFTGQPAGVWCTLTWKGGARFQFDSSGGLVAMIDRYNNAVTITRNQVNGFAAWVYLGTNTNRFLKYIQDAGNTHVVKVQAQYSYLGSLRTWNLTYDAAGKILTLKDPNSNGYTFSYTSYTRSDGVALPLLATITDARGMTPTSVHYDASGRVTALDSPLGGSHTFTYSAAIGANGTTTGTDPAGGQTSVSYTWNPTAHGYLLTQIRDITQNETTTIEHNAPPTYLPTAMVDYRGRRRSYSYNAANGDMTAFSGPTPSGGTASFSVTYNPTYHLRTSVTDPAGRLYQWGVDASGNVTAYTSPGNDVSTFTYNPQGQLVSSTNALHQTTTWGRDTYGLPVSTTDAGNHTSSVVRNDIGLITQVNDPIGSPVNYSYDLQNNCTTATYWLNNQPQNTNYTFDALGNMLTATDVAGHLWRWDYDCVGNVVKETNPLNQVRTWAWSPTNKLLTYTDFKGAKWAGTYLTDGRMSRADFKRPDGSTESSMTWAFDPATHLVSSITDSLTGTLSYQRDLLDQLTAFTSPNGSISYQYDILGRRTQMQVTGQNPITYGYNSRGNINTLSQDGQTTTFTYDAIGRLTGQNFPNGVITEREYDACGCVDMVCSAKNGVVFDATGYTHDVAHKVTSVNTNGTTQALTYDSLNRLTSAGNASWAYSPVGLRASQTVSGITTNYAYDSANNLTAVGGLAIARDLNGRPTAYNGRTYSWNVRGQLTGYTVAGSSFGYSYDPSGNRSTISTNGVAMTRLLDYGSPVRETSATATVDTLNGPTLGGPLKRGGYFYSTDGKGSTTKLTDGNGVVVGSYNYDPFGYATGSGSVSTPVQYHSGLTSHPTVVAFSGTNFSPEWGQPLGGVGVRPRGPALPSNPISAYPIGLIADQQDGPSNNDGSNQTAGAKDEEQHRKADSGGCNGGAAECFSGPPMGAVGEPAPEEPGSSGSKPTATIVPGSKIGLGVATQNPAFCKPGSLNTTQFARLTGADTDPFPRYGLNMYVPRELRIPCAINGAEEIHFNLDGFDTNRGFSSSINWTDGNMTNSEFQMCQSPEILPRVSWYQCGQIVPAPVNPYAGVNPDGAAGNATGASSQEPGSNVGR